MRKTGFSMDYIQNNRSLIKILKITIRNQWDFVGLSDYDSDVSFKFKDIAAQINRLHKEFKELNIQKGDKIAICDKNSSCWGVALLAVLTYRAVAVPVLADFNGEQIVNVIEHSDAKILIAGTQTKKKIEDAFAEMKKEKFDKCIIWDMDFIGQSAEGFYIEPDQVDYEEDKPEELAVINYTSGSTGHSKGVMLPYRSLWSNVAFADEKLGLKEHCSILSLLPMAHMYGFSFEFIYELCMGGHIHFLTKAPSPTVLLKALSDVKPDVVIAVPLIIEKIIQSRVFPMIQTKKMRRLMSLPFMKHFIFKKIRKRLMEVFGGKFYEVVVGGAAFNKEVEEFMHKIKFPYTVGYGMTECGPILCYSDWKKFAKGSCGRCVPRMELKVISKDPQFIEGEICVKGDNVMLGYYKNEEATKEAIDEEGWLHTGDLGTVDANGNVFIRGRQKNMLLNSNGQNIYPEEIEEKFTSHVLIDECVVIQRNDKLIGLVYTSDDTLKAHGMTRDDFNNQLDRYCKHVNTMLPSFYKVSKLEPRDIEFEKTPKRNIKRYLYT